MIDPRRIAGSGCISCDFDGVLSTLVLGRAWEKARAKKGPVPLVTPVARSFKRTMASLTEGLRKPLPGAENALRRLRSAGWSLCILTSRTGERVAAAERWLDRYGWTGLFDRAFFNEDGESADPFKARVLRAQAIDVHVDDDPETLALLSRLFPDRMFIHLNFYRRKGPAAGNIVTVGGWGDVPGLFLGADGGE